MIIIEKDFKPDFEWDSRLLKSKFGTIFQTKEYGQYIHSRLNAKPIYLKFIDTKGDIAGQLLLFQSFKGRKKLRKFFGKGILYSSISKIQKFLPKDTFWTFGPVVFKNSLEEQIANSLGNLLKSWKGNVKAITHPLASNFVFSKKFNLKKEKTSTFLIDLNQDLQTILKKTDKNSVQKNIKRSRNRGVKITEVNTRKDFLVYHELQTKYRLQNNMTPYLKEDTIESFEILSLVGYHGFIAWLDNEPVGGISISTFNGYINESGIARSETDTKHHLYSQDLLRWNIIEWGVENKCKYYDLSGVKQDNRSPKEEGIYRNKQKWGGTQQNYWTFLR